MKLLDKIGVVLRQVVRLNVRINEDIEEARFATITSRNSFPLQILNRIDRHPWRTFQDLGCWPSPTTSHQIASAFQGHSMLSASVSSFWVACCFSRGNHFQSSFRSRHKAGLQALLHGTNVFAACQIELCPMGCPHALIDG